VVGKAAKAYSSFAWQDDGRFKPLERVRFAVVSLGWMLIGKPYPGTEVTAPVDDGTFKALQTGMLYTPNPRVKSDSLSRWSSLSWWGVIVSVSASKTATSVTVSPFDNGCIVQARNTFTYLKWSPPQKADSVTEKQLEFVLLTANR
jgi:hypothetical protein